MEENELFENRRVDELNTIARFFTNIYAIPQTFKRVCDYKTFESDKHVYCIEYKHIKNDTRIKIIIPYDEYNVVDEYVRGVKDLENIDIGALALHYANNYKYEL